LGHGVSREKQTCKLQGKTKKKSKNEGRKTTLKKHTKNSLINLLYSKKPIFGFFLVYIMYSQNIEG
jgi:hypothetical protein